MTRIVSSTPPKTPKSPRSVRDRQADLWQLQDAKARFSEVVRRARGEGPQHVTVHGREVVVILSAEDLRRLKGDPTGEALVAAMQASPDRDIDIARRRVRFPVRDITL